MWMLRQKLRSLSLCNWHLRPSHLPSLLIAPPPPQILTHILSWDCFYVKFVFLSLCGGLRQLFQLARTLRCLSLAFASCLLYYASSSAFCPQFGSFSWKGSLLRLFFKFHQSSSLVNTHLIRSLLLSPALEEISLPFQLLSLTRPAGSSSKHLGLFWTSREVSLIPDADTANISGSWAFVC